MHSHVSGHVLFKGPYLRGTRDLSSHAPRLERLAHLRHPGCLADQRSENLLHTCKVTQDGLRKFPPRQLCLSGGLALAYTLQEVVLLQDRVQWLGLHEVNSEKLRATKAVWPVVSIDGVHDLGVSSRDVIIEEDAVHSIVMPTEEERFSTVRLQPSGRPSQVEVTQGNSALLAPQIHEVRHDRPVPLQENDVIKAIIEAGKLLHSPGLASCAHGERHDVLGRVAKEGTTSLRRVEAHPVVWQPIRTIEHYGIFFWEEWMPALTQCIQLLLYQCQVMAERAKHQHERPPLPLQLTQEAEEGGQQLDCITCQSRGNRLLRAADLRGQQQRGVHLLQLRPEALPRLPRIGERPDGGPPAAFGRGVLLLACGRVHRVQGVNKCLVGDQTRCRGKYRNLRVL
mmetsp:Transcript_117651/g.327589  ORF Transcript_117651/g.327589 Transcript_117651/m.327589 type:complete len:397 (-) Transcript_117651:930-2120(-)